MQSPIVNQPCAAANSRLGATSVKSPALKRLAKWCIKWYQAWSMNRSSTCRFTPTCSAYADEAIELHGVLKGGYYSFKRLLRCRPKGGWGYDPPPSLETTNSLKTHSLKT